MPLNTSHCRPLSTGEADRHAWRPAGWALGLAALLAIGGCSSISWPWSRNRDTTAAAPVATGTGTDTDAECDRLRVEIKNSEESRRNASAQSTSPEIVAAA